MHWKTVLPFSIIITVYYSNTHNGYAMRSYGEEVIEADSSLNIWNAIHESIDGAIYTQTDGSSW